MKHSKHTIVSLEAVHKTYQTKAGPFEALKGIDLQIARGEFAALVGPSGSGKSTLINMISGIDRPTAGEVYVAGERLTHLKEDEIALWRSKNVGVVFQFFQLLPTLTVLENVIMPMRYSGTYVGERHERAMELLELVDLADTAYKYPNQVSGGQQQRAAIARALANNPPLLVGDEPTGNLDTVSAALMFALFEDLVAQGRTVIIVTHDCGLAGQVPRVIEVREGQIFADDTVDQRLVG